MASDENSWEELFQAYVAARKSRPPIDPAEYIDQGCRLLASNTDGDWQMLAAALDDVDRKWFVAWIFKRIPLPERLFQPFIRAAIREPNPSFNRSFVEPCIASFGHRQVNEALLEVVEQGSDFEIAGAVQALYWANIDLRFVGEVLAYTPQHATPNSRKAYLDLRDVWDRKQCLYLRVFVTNEAIDVRRRIIPQLCVDEDIYPADLKPLVAKAIEIARSHPDDYIRHRVEVQLGNERLLKPIPPQRLGNAPARTGIRLP